MNLRAAIALFALAAPVFAQHGGGGYAGAFGSRGFAGRAGFSGVSGFSRPGSFVRPAPLVRFSAPGRAGLRGFVPQNPSSPPIFANGNRFATARPSYRLGSRGDWLRGAGGSRGRDHDRDRGHDRFEARRRSFANWDETIYPYWLGYPNVIDLGSYDWGESDDETSDQSAAANQGVAPYPNEDYGQPSEYPAPGFAGGAPPWNTPSEQQNRTAAPIITSAPVPEEPIAVIFKSGRAPVKIRNYIMTAKVLTDLDSRHYEEIPLDEIDLAATERLNSAAGVAFQIPDSSRD